MGFTAEDIVGAWQDSRLAEACVKAWWTAGRPDDFRVLRTVGAGAHVTHWFINETAARLLDREGVEWRSFLLAEGVALPDGARDALHREAGSS